ncbi:MULTISPECIES: ABC transporter permease subunit [Zhongshania]|jgi:phosphate transport system permease protein|uniref:Phosphate transport system permease protein n=1 Tax=Zhongshania antarctica TaxID=641702 RepID=A0A840R7G8_9GAMM|nr:MULTISPECIES: ABC transporter permease subunit [Zhongshania]MBB5188413.1 phosphate transport system permease protein [Zhongshania antarctica]
MSQSEVRATASAYRQWRKVKDGMATATITAGGISVLFAILLIFFYLLYEIMPLFQSASLDDGQEFAANSDAPSLYLAMEEQAEVGFSLDRSGRADFFQTNDGKLLLSEAIPLDGAEIRSFALDSEVSRIFALGLSNGRVIIAKHDYRTSFPNDKRLITPVLRFPYGEQSLLLSESEPIDHLAISDSDDELLLVAVSQGKLIGRRWVKEEDFLSEEVTLVEESVDLPVLDMSADRVLLGPDQRWLYVMSNDGGYRLIDLRRVKVADRGYLFDSGKLNEARFLLGGISLLTASDQGEVGQWFVVRDSERESGYRLQAVRKFAVPEGSGATLATEHRRKGFVSVSKQGHLDLFYTTSHRRLLNADLDVGRIAAIAISPRADMLLIENEGGTRYSYKLHNEHPELSWSALWSKVWYESYPEPDYVWQSSASTNDFEPKYSFAPLAFGTLKAAFYAMLIAAPLAICGAIYTAYFMAPALRRKVKPLIELMEALPTVILGFLAGLWLAPFIEKNMPAVFSMFLVLPFGILLFAWTWSKVPISLRRHVPDGWHPVLLVPVVLGIVTACVALGAPMERAFFGGDMRAWLTSDLGVSFDQRNALVVGIAMGFAVIPTIFSIAEDAIFSVPKHLSYGSLALGATPWQSLVGVVMPTASPGIFSALMIGMGRAVGETMIVLMATGNTPIMDANIFEGMRTLAANIAVEIGETEVASSHYRVLFLAAFVLFMFTFFVNTIAETVRQRLRMRYGNL